MSTKEKYQRAVPSGRAFPSGLVSLSKLSLSDRSLRDGEAFSAPEKWMVSSGSRTEEAGQAHALASGGLDMMMQMADNPGLPRRNAVP